MGARDARLPSLSNFHAVFGNFFPNNILAHPLTFAHPVWEILDLPLDIWEKILQTKS